MDVRPEDPDLVELLQELHEAVQEYDNNLYRLQPHYREEILKVARKLSQYYARQFIG